MSCLLSRLVAMFVPFCSIAAYGAAPFELLNREGTQISGAILQEMGEDRLRYRVDGNELELVRTSLVSIRSSIDPRPRSSGTAAVLRLVNGDILAGQLASLGDAGLIWMLGPEDRTTGVRLNVPLEYVLGISFGLSMNDALKALVPRESQTGADQLRLSNEDELTGDLSELSLEQLTLETETGTTGIPLKTVRTILFNEELTHTPARSAERTLIMLEPGTRITLSNFQISRDSLISGETVFGESLELSLNQLGAAVFLDPSVQPLSERKPESISYRPFLSAIPAIRTNTGVRGGLLQIGSEPYLTGLGMQSRTEMTWSLEPSDEFLISDIGLDLEAKQQGSLRFRVLLDGEQVFESSELTGGDAPHPLRIDLRQRKSLTLIADFGRDGDVLDLAVWGNALLLKSPASAVP